MCWKKCFNYWLILSHLQSTGHAFREKCNLHTDYNNQEIFIFELVSLKVDFFFLLSRYSLFHMSVRQPYAEFFFFFLTRFRDARKHVLLSLFYKSNILLILWVYRNKIILSCFIIRKQSCCLENKSSAVVLHRPYHTYFLSTFNSQITSCGPVEDSQRARMWPVQQ